MSFFVAGFFFSKHSQAIIKAFLKVHLVNGDHLLHFTVTVLSSGNLSKETIGDIWDMFLNHRKHDEI